MSTAVVWFRRDLRVHDLPALAEAAVEHDRVVPLFVLDPAILRGRWRSGPRIAFMLGCLRALDAELTARGSSARARRPRRSPRSPGRPAPRSSCAPTTARRSAAGATSASPRPA
jgi:deoxyribodipyrimidine photo-lyase